MPTPDGGDPLAAFPIRISLPVAWGEMDAFGHVNNIIYFRYFESARIAYFEAVGFLRHMEEEGVGPILAETSCRFRRALKHPDRITVGASAFDLGEDRFTMRYRVVREEDGVVAAEGEGKIVCYDYRSERKHPLPPSVREAIEALERTSGASVRSGTGAKNDD